MMSLVSLELRQAQLRKKSVLAKAHARFGLSLALGELNKHLGPDQRISASAALLEEEEPDDSGSELRGRQALDRCLECKRQDRLASVVDFGRKCRSI